MLTLSESQKRLLTAMTATNAHINCGWVWTGTGPNRAKHRIRDLYALRAAALVRSAEAIGDKWSVKHWQISEKGRAAAPRLLEQELRADSQSSAPRYTPTAATTIG